MKSRIWKFVIPAFALVLASAWTATAAHHEKDEDNGFVSIFDGKTLKGWHPVPADCMPDWSVEEGIIVGQGSVDLCLAFIRSLYIIAASPHSYR